MAKQCWVCVIRRARGAVRSAMILVNILGEIAVFSEHQVESGRSIWVMTVILPVRRLDTASCFQPTPNSSRHC